MSLPSTPAEFVAECQRRDLSPAQAWGILQDARPLLGSIGATSDAGQSGAATDWPRERVLERQRAMQEAFSRSNWASPGETRLAVVAALLGTKGSASMDEKKAFILSEHTCAYRNFAAVMGDEVDREACMAFLIGSDIHTRKAPQSMSWTMVEESAAQLAWRHPEPPSAAQLQASATDVAQQLQDFTQRFGFGVVRLAGFHTPAQATMALERFTQGCEILAQTTGLHEHEIGLDGMHVAIGAPILGWGSAFFDMDGRSLCCTAQAGWSAWAHEWFHALDNHLASKVLGQPTGALLSEPDADDPTSQHPVAQAGRLLTQTLDAGFETAAPGAQSAVAQSEAAPLSDEVLYARATGEMQPSGLPMGFAQAALDRVEKGIFDRFLLPRVPEAQAAQARDDFLRLFGDYFCGRASEQPIIDWQKQLLGSQSEHYARIGLAELDLAKAQFHVLSTQIAPTTSAFSRFASMADERMGFEYSSNPAEKWARSFEAAIHDKAPAELRPFFTLGSTHSGGFYPRGAEQERFREAMTQFFGVVREHADALGLQFSGAPNFNPLSQPKQSTQSKPLTQPEGVADSTAPTELLAGNVSSLSSLGERLQGRRDALKTSVSTAQSPATLEAVVLTEQPIALNAAKLAARLARHREQTQHAHHSSLPPLAKAAL